MAATQVRFREGDGLSAGKLNRVAIAAEDAAAVFGRGRGGRGLALLASLRQWIIPLRITAVSTAADPAVPSNVRYDFQPLWRGAGAAATNKAPDLGRPVRDDEFLIHPAKVDDPALLLRLPAGDGAGGFAIKAFYVVLTEAPAGKRCPLPARGGGGGDLSDLEAGVRVGFSAPAVVDMEAIARRAAELVRASMAPRSRQVIIRSFDLNKPGLRETIPLDGASQASVSAVRVGGTWAAASLKVRWSDDGLAAHDFGSAQAIGAGGGSVQPLDTRGRGFLVLSIPDASADEGAEGWADITVTMFFGDA